MMEVALDTRFYRDKNGQVWIEGANTKVIQIAMDQYAHHWSAEEIQAQHPHLTLAQIHAALSYYYDHRSEIDNEIERVIEAAEILRAQAGISRAEQRLREAGRLP